MGRTSTTHQGYSYVSGLKYLAQTKKTSPWPLYGSAYIPYHKSSGGGDSNGHREHTRTVCQRFRGHKASKIYFILHTSYTPMQLDDRDLAGIDLEKLEEALESKGPANPF
jgi:hypothetical protein